MRDQLQSRIDAIRGEDADERAAAASALAEVGPAAVGPLWPLLSDPRSRVRAVAAEALGKVGPAAELAVPALARLLQDRDPDVRQHAAAALQSIHPRYLSRRKLRFWFRGLSTAACLLALVIAADALDVRARAVGVFRGEKFFEGWPAHSWAERLVAPDGQDDVAAARLRAGGRGAVPVLAEIAADTRYPKTERAAAVRLLGRKDLAEAAVPILIPLLEDEERMVSEAAVDALAAIGSSAQAAVPTLYAALNKPVDQLRGAYASALEKIGGKAPADSVFVRFRDGVSKERPWFSFVFSADGKQLMAHRGFDVLVWDRSMSADSHYTHFSVPDGVRRAAIHPNGQEAVIADVGGGLTHYSLGDRRKLGVAGRLSEDVPVVPFRTWRRLAYSPDGRTLGVIRSDVTELYDVTRSPWERLPLQNPPKPVLSVMFSADGSTVALLDETKLDGAPALSSGAWWLVDLRTGKLRQRLPAGHVTGNETALSPNGQFLAVNSNAVGRRVHVWNTADGKQVSEVGDKAGAGITSVAFVGSDQLAVGTANGALAVWNARTGEKLRDLRWHTAGVEGLCVSPDGKTLASADERGWVKLWDLTGGAGGE
jgi:HEAT repeat protein